jgi:hypothetical protein
MKGMENACGKDVRPLPENDIGYLIYPGIEVPPSEQPDPYPIIPWWPRESMISRNDKGTIQAWLVGCLRYRDQFDFIYHNRFIYRMRDVGGIKNKNDFPIVPNSKVSGRFVQWRSVVDSGTPAP